MKYTNDRATQIVLSLLKAHGIKKVIASPGTTNIALVGSMQYDPWFDMYSAPDERSAAYMACGMASTSGEPVVISCTGATASRNYLPGLTEAYYRKLPILAITGSHGDETIGHLHAQDMDRSQAPKDSVRKSYFIDRICSEKDEWATITNVNKAIIELKRNGGGPVHINLRLGHGAGFTTEQLPIVRKIEYFNDKTTKPSIVGHRIVVFVGAHRQFTKEETDAIDKFCECNNGVVFCDLTSGYNGKFKVLVALIASQHHYDGDLLKPDLLIHIGEVSGEFYSTYALKSAQTWRVSVDGELRDLFGNLTAVFEMAEIDFFKAYTHEINTKNIEYYSECTKLYKFLSNSIPELPFGNLWMAKTMHNKLPKNCVFHTSIFQSLRSWNFFDIDSSITTSCNVGGFGIDGPISTILGSSLVNKDKIHILITGDLAFFYDMNSLGNRYIGKNLRILLINNGVGTEFRNYDHPGSQWGENANLYIAAGGHYGNRSKNLVKHYAQDLGFDYLCANSKEEFLQCLEMFVMPEITDKPVIIEAFTDSTSESDALCSIRSIIEAPKPSIKERVVFKAKTIVDKIVK